jgi:hypothetical protein
VLEQQAGAAQAQYNCSCRSLSTAAEAARGCMHAGVACLCGCMHCFTALARVLLMCSDLTAAGCCVVPCCSWAHGAFDVLHPAPGSRVLGPKYYHEWDRSARRHSSSDSSKDPSTPQNDAPESLSAQAAAAAVQRGIDWQQPELQSQQLTEQPSSPAAASPAASPPEAAAAAAAAAAGQACQQRNASRSPGPSDQSVNSQEATIS